MLESEEEIQARLVMAATSVLFEVYVKPLYPDLTLEDCPRRILYPTIERARLVAGAVIATYEATMELNGYKIPSLLSTPEDTDEGLGD